MAVVASSPKTKDVARWLNRQEAALLMDVAYTTLINLERRGLLHPEKIRGPHGQMIIVYDPDELIARVPRKKLVAQNALGERVARAYELFELGRSVNEVVIEMRETPAQVRDWLEEWQDGGGAQRTINKEARDELVAVVGEFGTVAELIERARELAAKKG